MFRTVTSEDIQNDLGQGEFTVFLSVEGGPFHVSLSSASAGQAALHAFWALKRAGAFRRGNRHTRACAAIVPAQGGAGHVYSIGQDGQVYSAGTCEARAA
jgi:hypothetical protein